MKSKSGREKPKGYDERKPKREKVAKEVANLGLLKHIKKTKTGK